MRSRKNVYCHIAAVTPILRLWLTIQIQKLKKKIEIDKTQIIGIQIYFVIKKYFSFLVGKKRKKEKVF